MTQVRYGKDKAFMVSLQDGSSIAADQVINCAWENMEAIDQTIGLFDVFTKSTNRLKALAVVDLPLELQDQHSMFFCMGPFCMLSNLGNGIGMMTYAPITNVANYQESKIDERGRKFLSGNASPEEIKHYGEAIIKGVSQWIPAIVKARLITVRFGIVKTYGDVDIFDPRSAVHSRDYFGVDSKQIGYIDNACMKLMNLSENAKLVVELFSQHLDIGKKIKTLSNSIIQKTSTKFPELLELFLNHYSRRQFSSQDFSSEKKVENLKSSLLRQIKNKKDIQTVFSTLPKDYSARLMLIFLAVSKILPNDSAEVVAGYCVEPKTIENSHPDFSFWPAQFLVGCVSRPLVIKTAISVDDSSLKSRIKPRKYPVNRSHSCGAMVLWNQSPKDHPGTISQHRLYS